MLTAAKEICIFKVYTLDTVSKRIGDLKMTAVVAKWGNSLAIRIPRAVAEQAQVTEGTGITFSVEGNSIVITPQKRKKYTLDELLSGMTPEKFHPEFETGNAVGNEDW